MNIVTLGLSLIFSITLPAYPLEGPALMVSLCLLLNQIDCQLLEDVSDALAISKPISQ